MSISKPKHASFIAGPAVLTSSDSTSISLVSDVNCDIIIAQSWPAKIKPSINSDLRYLILSYTVLANAEKVTTISRNLQRKDQPVGRHLSTS